MNIISDPQTIAPRLLGTATVENRSAFRRRVMQVVTLPLRESDGYVLGMPMTVVDSGTGMPERCQVEGWAMPYPSGSERIIRLTYPAILPASDLRVQHTFETTDGGQLPAFNLRPNVLQGLQDLVIDFFCGPKETGSADHWIIAKQAGVLPLTIYSGTRSRIYRWFGRVYDNPTVRTEFWTEIDVEVFHDEDYAQVWWRWGVCDPRISNPNGFSRQGLTDAETEVGYDFKPGAIGQYAASPVIFFPEQNVQFPVTWDGAQQKYRWVHDRRTLHTAGFSLNEWLPWGTSCTIKGAMLFRGLTGDLGSQIRNDSMAAWLATTWPSLGIANTWMQNQEAYGPIGMMPRRAKRHEHWEGTRDANYVRGALENEAVGLATRASDGSQTPYAFNISRNRNDLNLHGDPHSTSTGDHPSWTRHPIYAPIAYAVPGLGLHIERLLSVQPAPMFYREENGNLVTIFDHPLMNIDRMAPSTVGTDYLGKVGAQGYRTSGGFAIQCPSGGSTLAYAGGSANSHFENPNVVMAPAVFGDRGLARIAESMCYAGFLGDWAAQAWNVGATGQARAFARGCTMMAWFMWFFGRDTRIADMAYDALWTHYYLPANTATSNSLGLSPNRLVRTLNIYARQPGADVNQVILWNHEYTRPWEDCHGFIGWYGLPRLGAHLRPQLASWRTIGLEMCRDALRYASPRRVDESTGQILFTFISSRGYEIPVAAAIVDNASRAMSIAEISDNSYTRCGNVHVPRCPQATQGFMLLGAPGSGNYLLQSAAFATDLIGGENDIYLTRYAPTEGVFNIREDNPGGGGHITWINKHVKWMIGWSEFVFFGPLTTQGTHGLDVLKGLTTSRIYPFNAYIAWANQAAIKRLDRRNGGTVLDITPPITPSGGWSDVKCITRSGEDHIVLLDGRDTSQTRSSYQILSVTEQAPTVQARLVSFIFSDVLPRDVRAIAWDPHIDEFILAASRDGVSSFWRVSEQGGTAYPDTRIVVDRRVGLEFDIWSMDIDQDARLLIVANPNGNWQAYAYASGGYWGSPRSWYDAATMDPVVCFSRHARTDDLQRVISASNGGAFHEVEV